MIQPPPMHGSETGLRLVQVHRTVAFQPELADPNGAEVAISPVRMHHNGMAGEITFRWPPEMTHEEVTGALIKLLTASTPGI